jgi:hypothetical protein
VGIGLFEMSYDRWASFVAFSFVVKNTPGAAIRSAQYTLQFMWHETHWVIFSPICFYKIPGRALCFITVLYSGLFNARRCQ